MAISFGTINNENFITNNIDEIGLVTYIGKENKDGIWIIQKIDETSGTLFSFASSLNNATYTYYDVAWSCKTVLTYGAYNEAI